ncbi:MAG: type II secretion system protein [Undibacterium sp.]|nr:type II secretion system protein [Opitutaceae bacterium]
MNSSVSTPRWLGRQRIPHSGRAVGMVELMVVITIISMLITVIAPSYIRIQRKARAAAMVNDFRVFSSVFLAHAHEVGSWPAEAPAGVMPAEITSAELKRDNWSRVTAIGGKFDWEYNQVHNGTRYRAAIAITDTVGAPLLIDLNMFQEMDKALDDGNLATGNFILGFGNSPLLILEP